jgi:ATP-dependent DNA ligase
VHEVKHDGYRLMARRRGDRVRLYTRRGYAFDLLEFDGLDCRPQPLAIRKTWLRRLLAGTEGIQFSERIKGDGQKIFEAVCKMGLEGIVSKRIDSPYMSGRSRSWIQVRNPVNPAMLRYENGTF